MKIEKHTLLKEPAEKFVLSVNFGEVLGAGEIINSGSSSVTGYDATGSLFSDMVVSGSLFVSASNLGATVQSGSLNNTYKTVFKAVTSEGNIWVDNVYITVLEA